MEHDKNSSVKKPEMTEQERLELAAKLDKDLDDFINNLPKRERQPNDKPMDDAWVEELQSHPFFMKKLPEPGEKLHPLYEGLQKLKYDPEENEPLDLALAYKEDGNCNFKHKNYRLAILAYTEGIMAKCGDIEVESVLLNNRSAANYFLRNYRSSLRDCELALKLKPDYDKAIIRAANCLNEMKKYDKAVEYCDKILDKSKDNKEMIDLRKKCINSAKLKERNERKRELENKKREMEEENLAKEIISRGIKIEGGKGNITLNKLEPCFPQLVNSRVFLDDNQNLVWPVVFLYPEYKIMDYIQGFSEKQTFLEQINEVFGTFPEWDENRKYRPENLIVYFETPATKLVNVNLNKTLEEILKMKEYLVKGGTPSFLVLVKDSPAHKKFLENY